MEQNYQSQYLQVLHSVRKHSLKPWKKHIAPMPPVPPRVYRVDSESFKQVVQELTAGPKHRPCRLKSLAPHALALLTATDKKATLELLPSPSATPTWSDIYKELMSDGNLEMTPPRKHPLGLGLSPTFRGVLNHLY